jgi:putative protease
MGKRHNAQVELLAPAGNVEKLEIVLHYGADAVYLAGKDFSLRNFSGNFTLTQLQDAISLAHAYNANVYVAVNIFARNRDLALLEKYLMALKQVQPDGIIAADPAVVVLARKYLAEIPVHLSTQANTTNKAAARFWRMQGISRINAARELSLKEIAELATEQELEIEAFVHGAMCISYSGRCLLSNYMAQRPSNQGMCCQPCRFNYAVVEETRPGQYFPVCEDRHGTYIFNSRDLCMLSHLPAMIASGVRSLKIEGRMKGINYAATAVKIYREAIDHYYQNPADYRVQAYWQEELNKITSRGYCTGFYLDDPNETVQNDSAPSVSLNTLMGKVLSSAGKHKAHIEVRNQIRLKDQIEILKPKGPPVVDTILRIMDAHGQTTQLAQPGSRVTIWLNTDCDRFDLLRRSVPLNAGSASVC